MTGRIRFRSGADFREGAVFAVDKPGGWTSFDVVNKVRISLRPACGKIKVGHAGTLDPLATGVMVICTGKETREIERYMGQEKEYVARVTFGHTTPSYDLESAFDGEYDYSRVDRALLERVARRFVGEIEQFPPAFSAVRVNGVRAYEMARAGDQVEMKSRRVEVKELEIVEEQMPEVVLRVRCGKGTYIRSLAHDIGRECDSGSHLSALRRTRVGEFRVEEAFRVEEIVRLLESNRVETT
ncbi:MAG: tRNA pseudouridine(55) synthase TruB [Odoribacteraceae bacterium]|jgi:tRNA pseudouridine55 synthase|nr:tRNA pseudouridine(55) synthase TruB [Odoribacteraceae bacterium]